MQTLSIVSPIKNYNEHVLIDHFHFKHEMRIKENLWNQVYKKSQSGQKVVWLLLRDFLSGHLVILNF